jgi:hypothetical protein
VRLWVVHRWVEGRDWDEEMSRHLTLEAAIEAAATWKRPDLQLLPQWRTVYSVAEYIPNQAS